jgi:hypothetical protein
LSIRITLMSTLMVDGVLMLYYCPFAENFYEIANFLTAIYGGIA